MTAYEGFVLQHYNYQFDLPVVGESRYQDAISRIVGGKTDESACFECKATLHLEDENRYDPNAVRVEIDGQTVGYLARPDAVDYRKALALNNTPRATITCRAMIVGGWSRGGDEGTFGVKLQTLWKQDDL